MGGVVRGVPNYDLWEKVLLFCAPKLHHTTSIVTHSGCSSSLPGIMFRKGLLSREDSKLTYAVNGEQKIGCTAAERNQFGKAIYLYRTTPAGAAWVMAHRAKKAGKRKE